MEKERNFLKTVCNIAIPVTLQCMLQSSFSMADQIMIGRLGSVSIAGVGLAGKFLSIFNVVVAAIAAVAGIMIAQYMGKKEKRAVSSSFMLNLLVAIGLAVLFTLICAVFPSEIMSVYSKKAATVKVAASYLRILSVTFFPIAISTLVATLLRCMEKASLPLYASIFAAVVNTGLNYVLIFGKFVMPKLGVSGAAIATVISQLANVGCICIMFLLINRKKETHISLSFSIKGVGAKQYLSMLLPLLFTELMWSLGENVYAIIYGNIGTNECAAMTLTNPIQGLLIGALSGLAQAAGIIIGKELGKNEFESAYEKAKKLMIYGLMGSIVLSLLLILLSPYYVQIYHVEKEVKTVGIQLLIAFAIISPVKVQNMILGGGIIRSGGKTKYVMVIDMVGTWLIGVPLGFLTAFVFHLPIPYVYFILSLEECVRLLMGLIVFRKKGWMHSLESEEVYS